MRTLLAIGKLVKAKRTELKIPLSKLSKKAFGNVHNAKAISLIERGLSEKCEFATIEKILLALDYDLKDLFLSELAEINKKIQKQELKNQ